MNRTAPSTSPHPEPVEGSPAAEQSLIDEVISRTPQIPAPQFAIPRDWAEVEALAKRICDAGWCPKSHCDRSGKPNQASVELAILQGMELGVAPLMAVQGIAIINGVPAVWGDLMLAVVTASGLLEYKREWIEGAGDDMRAVCEVKRTTRPEPIRREFSVAMAKRAQLSGKTGPWQGYPSRMLAMRARSWALRDEFTEVLKGMASMEELRDSGALQRAIAATEQGAGTAAAITADLKGAAAPAVGDALPDGNTVRAGDPRHGPPSDLQYPVREEEPAPSNPSAKPEVPATTAPHPEPVEGPASGDLLTESEADWLAAAQAMIARIDEATSIADLDVLVASGHVAPELKRMVTAGAHKQHDAVAAFIEEKRRGLGG